MGKGKGRHYQEEDKKGIETFKNDVMKGWISCVDLTEEELQSGWARTEFDKIENERKITDNAIRDDFLKEEFQIHLKQGFYGLNHDMDGSTKMAGVELQLKAISEKAFSNGTFGNNASSTKFYSKDGDWERMKPKLADPIMERKMSYNCNGPNAGDPAPSCPRFHMRKRGGVGGALEIVLKATDDKMIRFIMTNMPPSGPKNLTESLLSYEIKYKGNVLRRVNHPVYTLERGKRVEGLSKSTVISKVFLRMREIVGDTKSSNSEILKQYNNITDAAKKDIKSIVEIFLFKIVWRFWSRIICFSFLEAGKK